MDAHANDGEIERAGGWRLFMRQPAEEGFVPKVVADGARLQAFPRAALGRAFWLAKCGDIAAARRQLDLFNAWLGPAAAGDRALAADFVLVDAHVRLYADDALDSSHAEALAAVRRTLPADDLIGHALAFNHLSTVALHQGSFDQALEHANAAMRLFRQDGAEFGSLHLHTHLGQIRLVRGDLSGAEAQYHEMQERLADLPGDSAPLAAVGRVMRAEVAYEMNELMVAMRLLDSGRAGVEVSDAWLDVLVTAYRVRSRIAMARAGLPGALTTVAQGEQLARRRRMPRLERLMRIERARAMTLADELEGARRELAAVGLDPEAPDAEQTPGLAMRHGSSLVAIGRWLVRARRARAALAFLEPAEDVAIRGGQLLVLAKLRVIRAAACWRLNARGDATGAMLSAIRLLGRQPFRRFILDEGADAMAVVQAALDGDHVAVSPTTEQRRRLAELTHYWAVRAPAEAETAADPALATDAGEALRRRYLELLAHGHSNKEISRIMGVSANTVKYHLRQIFRELRVDNRTRAVRRARELGIVDV